MKDVIKAMCVIVSILAVCVGLVLFVSRSGLCKRRYFTVQES